MSKESLQEAGAPELPEGYFFRVHTFFGGRFLKVALRKEKRFGSAFINDVTVKENETVPEACTRLWKLEESYQTYFSKVEQDKKWIGDHR